MPVDEQTRAMIMRLEESLWKAHTRFDRDYMERVLHPEFFEFGCSGRRYNREQTLAMTGDYINIKLPLDDFTVGLIAPRSILTTYISKVQYDTLQVCNRSSIWVQDAREWRLRFHQGTPLP